MSGFAVILEPGWNPADLAALIALPSVAPPRPKPVV
jgi:hypothetical protein